MDWLAKPGVNLSSLRPELSRLEPLVCGVFQEWNAKAVVTCTDGDHAGRVSYHNPPFNAAFDLRVHHIGGPKQQTLFHAALKKAIEEAWPDFYDVILESPGKENAHIHVECGPLLAVLMFGHSHIQVA